MYLFKIKKKTVFIIKVFYVFYDLYKFFYQEVRNFVIKNYYITSNTESK